MKSQIKKKEPSLFCKVFKKEGCKLLDTLECEYESCKIRKEYGK